VLDTDGLPDNVVWKGDAKMFRTGPWNGLWLSGIPEVLSYKNLIEYQMLISSRVVTYVRLHRQARRALHLRRGDGDRRRESPRVVQQHGMADPVPWA
jgi:hypothetical protein